MLNTKIRPQKMIVENGMRKKNHHFCQVFYLDQQRDREIYFIKIGKIEVVS